MKNKIFSILLALTLILAGTIGMAANTVTAADDTQAFYATATYNGYTIGYFQHQVYWEWDYTYVLAWNLTISGSGTSSGGYTGVYNSTASYGSSANYASWLYCGSTGAFDVYYNGVPITTVYVTIETRHGADGGYWRIS